jgi:hypothetical protein
MSVTLHIKDETAAGKLVNELSVHLSSNLCTVKEIVIQRVVAEVEAFNNRMPEYFKGLIQPSDAESTLNGFKLKAKKKVNAEAQIQTALEAFERNGYFILIDNIQAESLDQMVIINDQTTVSFVKLTPLVGG